VFLGVVVCSSTKVKWPCRYISVVNFHETQREREREREMTFVKDEVQLCFMEV
jgi:hypothetical protein